MAKLASALPISVLTDSYKATHYLQYPAAKEMVAVSALLGRSPICLQHRAPGR